MRPEFIMAISKVLANGYSMDTEIDYTYAFDSEVTDCLMQMYFYMISGDDEHFNEFNELFDKLTPEKQEYVKKDFLSIIESQEKQKVRKREDNIYE